MEIRNLEKLKLYCTCFVCDILNGECFHFLNVDSNILYMRVDDSIIDLETGETFPVDYTDTSPVLPVNVEITVL